MIYTHRKAHKSALGGKSGPAKAKSEEMIKTDPTAVGGRLLLARAAKAENLFQ